MTDLDELAARAAIACWRGAEGTLSRAIKDVVPLPMTILQAWLSRMGLARSVPTARREGLLAFLNDRAIPQLRDAPNDPSPNTFSLVEKLSQEARSRDVLNGRPTSLLSKLGLAVHPELFIPYDGRVFRALKGRGARVQRHIYSDYMTAVFAQKPAFLSTLNEKNLSSGSLGAADIMSQHLFELRALDKRLMLAGGFDKERMLRDLKS
jgi:hypothetical protein